MCQCRGFAQAGQIRTLLQRCQVILNRRCLGTGRVEHLCKIIDPSGEQVDGALAPARSIFIRELAGVLPPARTCRRFGASGILQMVSGQLWRGRQRVHPQLRLSAAKIVGYAGAQ